jgi:hypothetical protein
MINILDKKITSNFIDFDLNTEYKEPEYREMKVVNNKEQYKCFECNQFKIIDEFKKYSYNLCQKCANLLSNIYENSPRGSFKILIKSSKRSTEHRKKINNTKRDNSYDIDFDYLVELFNKQNGLCAISGLPIQFGNTINTNWTCSIERIDVFKGYVKENISLICLEFQATDHSVRMKEKPKTSTSWTREKFKLFETSIRQKILNNELPITENEELESLPCSSTETPQFIKK